MHVIDRYNSHSEIEKIFHFINIINVKHLSENSVAVEILNRFSGLAKHNPSVLSNYHKKCVVFIRKITCIVWFFGTSVRILGNFIHVEWTCRTFAKIHYWWRGGGLKFVKTIIGVCQLCLFNQKAYYEKNLWKQNLSVPETCLKRKKKYMVQQKKLYMQRRKPSWNGIFLKWKLL